MKKNDIKKQLNISEILRQCEDDDVNVKINNYSKVEAVLEGLAFNISEKRKKIEKSLCHCSSCGKYFKNNPKNNFSSEGIENRISYWDSGYGDDDRYVSTSVLYIKTRCPFCKKEIQLDKFYGNDIPGTEHDKYGKIYN